MPSLAAFNADWACPLDSLAGHHPVAHSQVGYAGGGGKMEEKGYNGCGNFSAVDVYALRTPLARKCKNPSERDRLPSAG